MSAQLIPLRPPGSRITVSQADLLGLGTLAVAVAALVTASRQLGPAALGLGSLPDLVIALCLATGILLAYKFPIHVRHKTTMQVTGVPIYLLVALLPPVLAALAVGAGILAGEIAGRCRCANPWGHMLTHAARLSVVALAAALLAHLKMPVGAGTLRELPLLGAGVALWLGDFLSVLVILVPISQERPTTLFLSSVKGAGMQEGAQYFVGLLGALAAMQQVWALALLALPTALLYLGLNRGMDKRTREILESMADAVDLRSPWTAGHSRRVAELVAGTLAEMKLAGPETPLIVFAARVHDIGKISVPDQLLKKDGVLSPEEQETMQGHAEQGAALLMRYPDLSQVAELVRYHHERWDGQGYPHGLAGTEIPFGSRVIAVAASYAAMTSDRPYRRALSPDRAAAILRDGRGQQWDPQIVDVFLRSLADQLSGQEVPQLRVVAGGMAW